MIGDRDVKTVFTGIRPGEKVHEVLVSEEEGYRTVTRSDKHLAILPMLPELPASTPAQPLLKREYSSADNLMGEAKLRKLLDLYLLTDVDRPSDGELLA
jgi:FlaA1/EpsC-like NDP-sugar epimerase